jgi:hypothetical protein
MCCRQSALSMCTVSFVNAQCSETRSLAANKSLRVSILLAAEGNTIEGRFVFPFKAVLLTYILFNSKVSWRVALYHDFVSQGIG